MKQNINLLRALQIKTIIHFFVKFISNEFGEEPELPYYDFSYLYDLLNKLLIVYLAQIFSGCFFKLIMFYKL